MAKSAKKKRRKHPKTVLKLPDLELSKSLSVELAQILRCRYRV
jgi:hypothetical protein